MKKRCTPRLILDLHDQLKSWKKATRELNRLYDVNLHQLNWRDFAMGRRDIADPRARAALLLGPRPCSKCGSKPGTHFVRLLKRLKPKDMKRWQRLRRQKKYKAAKQFLDEVYSRKLRKKEVKREKHGKNAVRPTRLFAPPTRRKASVSNSQNTLNRRKKRKNNKSKTVKNTKKKMHK